DVAVSESPAHGGQGGIPPSFSKFTFPPKMPMSDGVNTLYSKAALNRDSVEDIMRRASAGEIPQTQAMQLLASYIDKADVPNATYERLMGATKESFKGGLSRFYLSNFST